MAVILETSLGDITVDLFTEERPRCCLNFLKLCKVKYYNFCLFHSVQRNLVAQTGDPTSTGKGGESIFCKLYGEQARFFEMEMKPRIKHRNVGTLSMVNNGDDMHGSQFFITTGAELNYLDGKHTPFGEVSEGLDVLAKINEAYVDDDNRPFKDIRINHTVVLDDPFDDPDGLGPLIPDRSPEPTKEQLKGSRIGADEEVDDTKGMTEHEVQEMIEDKDAKANAKILEIIGDLPDADIKPPDNVLFVCKLNPVTTAEDLEVIFSRFGEILSCEVITDQKTGESLQYAFIEFETEEQCSAAYFKMDNVLIDDRRIHVDFSQSVAKVKWKGKGKGVEYPKQEKEEERPQYVIKDRSRKDNYDYVFEEEDERETKSKKSKKKKKKHKKERDSSSDSDYQKHKKVSRRSRSRSPQYKDRKQYKERSAGRHRSRSRSHSRDRERARYRDSGYKERDRKRDSYDSRDRNRDRDRGRRDDYRSRDDDRRRR